MAELFQKGKSTINEHVLNIFKEEEELKESEVKRKIGIFDFSTKPTSFYNLDVIISVEVGKVGNDNCQKQIHRK